MSVERPAVTTDGFDLAKWAGTRGIPANRQRPGILAELLGVTPDYIRKVIAGSRGPSKTVVLLALMLDRLRKLEADIARDQRERANAAIDHLGAQKNQLAMTREKLMSVTRDDGE